MNFKLRQLEAFQAVARTGSVTRAAEALGISQPAASRLLSDFSRTIGFELFRRDRGSLIPTHEARHMLVEVTRILEGLGHLEELRRDLTDRTAGHLRVACLPGFAVSHLPGLLSAFLKERPGVSVTLEPDRPERILEWIIGQQYDCGITDGFSGHASIDSRDLLIRSACILPPGHPLASEPVITPADLADEKIIHTRRDSRFFGHLQHAFSSHGVTLRSWIEVRQFTTACTIISKGDGAAVVSVLDAEQFRDRGIVIRPFAPEIYHRVSLLRPISGNRSLLTRDFLDMFERSLTPWLVEPGAPTA